MPLEAMIEWGITFFIFALMVGVVALAPWKAPTPPKDEIERFPAATGQGGVVDGQFDEQIRAFLRLLDECQTEEARIECVAVLIFGVVERARRALRAENEKSHHEPERNLWTN